MKQSSSVVIEKALKTIGVASSSKSSIVMTSKQYREFQNIINNTTPSKKQKSLLDGVSYQYSIEFIDEVTAKITLKGKHFSRNRINTMRLQEKMRLKTLIKDSAKIFFLKHKEISKKCVKWESVSIHYDIYNPKSRDTNATDLKTFRDTFVINNLIKDDNREVIKNLSTQKEILDKEYKIIAFVSNLTSKNLK